MAKMKTVNVEKQQPTQEEKNAAFAMQAPSSGKISMFRQLAKSSRSARLAFGGGGQWIKAEELFSGGYRDGLESPPFFITKAFRFTSKQGLGERFGMEIFMANNHVYNVAFPYNEGDSKRTQILEMFKDKTAEPLGPVCLRMLDLNKGNAYYDICAYEEEAAGESAEIPFAEIRIDDPEMPF